jgi:fructose-1,6-bisphosphatase
MQNGLSHVRKFIRTLSNDTIELVQEELAGSIKSAQSKLATIDKDSQGDLHKLFSEKLEYLTEMTQLVAKEQFAKMN